MVELVSMMEANISSEAAIRSAPSMSLGAHWLLPPKLLSNLEALRLYCSESTATMRLTRQLRSGGGKVPYVTQQSNPACERQSSLYRQIPQTRLVARRRMVFATSKLEIKHRCRRSCHFRLDCACLQIQRSARAPRPFPRARPFLSKQIVRLLQPAP